MGCRLFCTLAWSMLGKLLSSALVADVMHFRLCCAPKIKRQPRKHPKEYETKNNSQTIQGRAFETIGQYRTLIHAAITVDLVPSSIPRPRTIAFDSTEAQFPICTPVF
ncbi:hypothetical protein K440DRAFT_632749 [Wilcoxina mikolae CBS 423.85]|nr:hypothetical protein K440DRAFT_632749 [Wilcoxina mikolae CBS 423.85]